MLPFCHLTLTLALFTLTHASSRPLWGTYRPHALISARAAAPHSPSFGFVYHPASSLEFRHLATDNHDKVSSFSYSRHDGRNFGDQEIIDTALNLRIRSHFQHHRTATNAWALRVSAAPLDLAKPAGPISLVFYAVAGPEDIDSRVKDFKRRNSALWGKVGLSADTQASKHGVYDSVALEGIADSVGGAYRVVVTEPAFGSLSPSSMTLPNTSGDPRLYEVLSVGGSGSRSLRRARAQKPAEISLPVDAFHVASSSVGLEESWAVEKSLRQLYRKTEASSSLAGQTPVYMLRDSSDSASPGVFVQRLVEPSFQMDVIFAAKEGRSEEDLSQLERDLSGASLDASLELSRAEFDTRFEKVFRLREKGVSGAEIAFARAALSNVLGGIGFFHGSSVVHARKKDSADGVGVAFLDPVSLLTATPSRSSFPRGFLWDEGFHQLIVQRWDPELSRDCMTSWMALIQESGWIPREQILGLEARSRFPRHVQHLMIQNSLVANPPAILMPLRVFASVAIGSMEDTTANDTFCEELSDKTSVCSSENVSELRTFSRAILKPVTAYYTWLKRTQSGPLPNSYRWRGRSLDIKAPEGYPLTLASGLDDYPRAEDPSAKERHVDLHSWISWASGTLARLSDRAGEDSASFWNEHIQLRKNLVDLHGGPGKADLPQDDLMLCDYDGEDKLCHQGYVTILPFALGLLEPSDPRVASVLDSLEDPMLLRSGAGIRSLSKSDKWYRKGDDYWTGPVWMPFNFLILAALRTKYSVEKGPYMARAEAIFEGLQKSILSNSFRVFSETGQLWENYSPEEEGNGRSGRQFTGWSALICLMYADMYDGVT